MLKISSFIVTSDSKTVESTTVLTEAAEATEAMTEEQLHCAVAHCVFAGPHGSEPSRAGNFNADLHPNRRSLCAMNSDK